MEYEITTEIKGNKWEQAMVCKFPNEAIARLVLEGTRTCYRSHKLCFYADGYGKAELARKDETVTAICKHSHHFKRAWDSDYEANKQHLETLAQEWKAESDEWLQMHRYYVVAVKPILERLARNTLTIKQGQEERMGVIEEQIQDVLDCLDMDDERMNRIETALQEHSETTLAHFPLIGKRTNLQEGKDAKSN